MRKIIKVSAYLDHNVGDDLMVELLIKAFPNYVFWDCIAYQKKTLLMEEDNFFNWQDIYSRFGRLNHLLNILTLYKREDFFFRFLEYWLNKRCVCAVAIGGSIFRPVKGETIAARIERETKKKACGKPFFVISANFGPYEDEYFRSAFHSFFQLCQGVTFRDRASWSLFRDIPHVAWAPDVVFNIPLGKIGDNGTMLISVINLNRRDMLLKFKEDYENKIKELCEYAIHIGQQPILVSFCKREGDEQAIREIIETSSDTVKNGVSTYFYDGNTEELLNLYRNSHFVVATRFHSMILGMRFHKPLFTFSYELKSDNVLNDTHSIAHCQFNEIKDMAVSEILRLGAHVVPIDDYITNAEMQFHQLSNYLESVKK